MSPHCTPLFPPLEIQNYSSGIQRPPCPVWTLPHAFLQPHSSPTQGSVYFSCRGPFPVLPKCPAVIPPPCFCTDVSSAPHGMWKFCLRFWSTFIHVAEKSFVPSCRSCSPLSDLQVKTRFSFMLQFFAELGFPVTAHQRWLCEAMSLTRSTGALSENRMRKSFAHWSCKISMHNVTNFSALLTQVYVCGILLTCDLAPIFWASYQEERKKPP